MAKQRVEICCINPRYFSVFNSFFDEGESCWRSEDENKRFYVCNPICKPPIWPVIEETRDGFDRLEKFEVVDYSSVSSKDVAKKAYNLAKKYAQTKGRNLDTEILDESQFTESDLEASLK